MISEGEKAEKKKKMKRKDEHEYKKAVNRFNDHVNYEMVYKIANADHAGKPARFVELMKGLHISNMKTDRLLKKLIELGFVHKNEKDLTYSLNYQNKDVQYILKQKPLRRPDVEYTDIITADYRDTYDLENEGKGLIKDLLGDYYPEYSFKVEIGMIGPKGINMQDYVDEMLLVEADSELPIGCLELYNCIESVLEHYLTHELGIYNKTNITKIQREKIKDFMKKPFAIYISNSY